MAATSIMIVGVGGQGTLLASRLLGSALLSCGYDVKVSEVHGMSQRGGSVVTYVKYGENVASPVIEKGEADFVLAFELLEAARWLSFIKPEGKLIVNEQKIDPMPVITGAAAYPEGVLKALRDKSISVTAVNALDLAVEAGSPKAVNVVLLGAMASQMDLSAEVWQAAIRQTVPPKFLDLNLKAFDLGYNFLNRGLTKI